MLEEALIPWIGASFVAVSPFLTLLRPCPIKKGHLLDPHLARMLTSQRKCRCCGGTFAQLLSLSCDRPDLCPEDFVVQDNSAILAQGSDILTEDFCRFGGMFFLRAVLAFPLVDARGHEFILGTWANVEQADFEAYLDHFDMRETEEMDSCRAKLANAIPPGITGALPCMLHMRPDGQYPELQIADESNPLSLLQQNGAKLEDLLELLYAYGHDLASLIYDA